MKFERKITAMVLFFAFALAITAPAFATEQAKIDSLCQKLGSYDEDEAQKAVEGLAKIGKPAVPKVIEVLKTGNPYIFRLNAATTLGLIGDKRAVSPLINALNDEYAFVHEASVVALGLIGDKSAVTPIMKAMDKGNFDLKKAGAMALGRLQDKKAIPLLKKLSNHKDEGVANAAKKALAMFKK